MYYICPVFASKSKSDSTERDCMSRLFVSPQWLLKALDYELYRHSILHSPTIDSFVHSLKINRKFFGNYLEISINDQILSYSLDSLARPSFVIHDLWDEFWKVNPHFSKTCETHKSHRRSEVTPSLPSHLSFETPSALLSPVAEPPSKRCYSTPSSPYRRLLSLPRGNRASNPPSHPLRRLPRLPRLPRLSAVLLLRPRHHLSRLRRVSCTAAFRT